MTIPITRALQIDLYAYTAAVRNARADYRARPITACTWAGCFEAGDPIVCAEHAQERTKRLRRYHATKDIA